MSTESPGRAVPGERSMWAAAHAYERFMGRWSRRVAVPFVDALPVPAGARWLDVGCGAGSLTAVIVERCAPSSLVEIDPSSELLRVARSGMRAAPQVRFEPAAAERLPFGDDRFDAAVSGLALNFVADPACGLREMARVTRSGGTVAAYVWDYDHADFFLARFWRAAAEAHGGRVPGDERGRWRLCSVAGLTELAERTDLLDPHIWTIDIETTFDGPEALWEGFLLGVGPSGSWATALSPDRREQLRACLEASLPLARDGHVCLTARALAVTGRASQTPGSGESAGCVDD
jgi:SAM-dependent methyltransferase